jgi:hypothetical protein
MSVAGLGHVRTPKQTNYNHAAMLAPPACRILFGVHDNFDRLGARNRAAITPETRRRPLRSQRPTCSKFVYLLSPGADMVGEKTPLLRRTFRLDTSAGFGKRASIRFRAPRLPLPVAGLGLSTTFLRAACLGASGPADDSAGAEASCGHLGPLGRVEIDVA